jgi:hypothetical protein
MIFPRTLLLPILLLAGGAHAENSAFVLPFGGEPGAPLPHAYDYGKIPVTEGNFVMRIPAVDTEVASVLHDTEMVVGATDKLVREIHAARAFRAIAECEAGQKILEGKLARVLPTPFTGEGPWQFQSADGAVVGGAWCHTARHLPFTTLFLDLRMHAAGVPDR